MKTANRSASAADRWRGSRKGPLVAVGVNFGVEPPVGPERPRRRVVPDGAADPGSAPRRVSPPSARRNEGDVPWWFWAGPHWLVRTEYCLVMTMVDAPPRRSARINVHVHRSPRTLGKRDSGAVDLPRPGLPGRVGCLVRDRVCRPPSRWWRLARARRWWACSSRGNRRLGPFRCSHVERTSGGSARHQTARLRWGSLPAECRRRLAMGAGTRRPHRRRSSGGARHVAIMSELEGSVRILRHHLDCGRVAHDSPPYVLTSFLGPRRGLRQG